MLESPWARAAIGVALITLVFYFSVTALPYIIADNLA